MFNNQIPAFQATGQLRAQGDFTHLEFEHDEEVFGETGTELPVVCLVFLRPFNSGSHIATTWCNGELSTRRITSWTLN